MQSLEGQSFGDYEIQAKLGQGGMGAVYKAQQTLLQRAVALKVMAPQLAEDPAYAARFIREAAAAANLNHPNMVLVYTAGKIDGTHYIAMEFVDGESLRKRLDREGRLEPREAVAITVYITQALQYAWNKARLIHRDIKPDNIFLSKAGEVKVGDLGLAKSVGSASTDLTASGMAMGSPHYISPEQARGLKEIDFRADIYSLGCTLYHTLTGRTPYEGDDSMSIMMKHVNDPPPAIFRVWPQCPMPLGMLVGKMLAKDRNARPRSYEDLLADLLAVHEKLKQTESPALVAAAPAPAKAPTPPAPVSVAKANGKARDLKPATRNSKLVIGGAVAAVAVVGIAGLLLWAPWKARQGESGERQAEGALSVEREASSTSLQHSTTPAVQHPAAPKVENWQDWMAEQRHAGKIPDNSRDDGTHWVSTKQGVQCRMPFLARDCAMRATFEISELGCAISLRNVRRGRQGYYALNTNKNEISLCRFEGDQLPLRNVLLKKWPLPASFSLGKVVTVEFRAVGDTLSFNLNGVFSESLCDSTLNRAGEPALFCRDAGIRVSRIEFLNLDNGIPAPVETRVAALTANPRVGEVCALDLNGGVTMDLVGIPPGEFMLGSTKEERAKALADGATERYVEREGEQPRKTMIKRGFWLGRMEVTVAQWKQFVAATGYVTNGEKKGESSVPQARGAAKSMRGKSWRDPNFGFEPKDNHPVSCISWNDALAFCEWFNEREQKAGRLPPGFKVRLPTEAEWEYACRAGTQTMFWWGESRQDGKGRLNWRGGEDGFEFVSPADYYGERGRNKFGLADMLGNVYEWCLDEYDDKQAHEEYYRGNPGMRVSRGGSFLPDYGWDRCALRRGNTPSSSMANTGFRMCVGPDMLGSAATTGASAAPQEAGVLAPAETRVAALTANPRVGEVCALDLNGGVTMELMGIPPGEFMLGSTPEERAWAVANGNTEDRLKCEGDQPRRTTIKQGFWLGRTEVTVGQWKQFVDAMGYVTDGEKKGESHGPVPGASSWGAVKDANWKDPKLGFTVQDSLAVSCISWDDAVAFCEWLNDREQKAGRLVSGFKVRLPTEAEWEYACRAGVQAKFWWGDTVEGGDKRLNWMVAKRGFNSAPEVDSYGARGRNRFGLANMLGNVKEWCLDHFDPTGAHEELYIGDPSKRVVRGGSSYNSRTAGNIRCAGRGSAQATTSHCDYGFRICVGPDVLGLAGTTAAPVTRPSLPVTSADLQLSAFCREVAALSAEAQVARVVAKLKELNPGYDGQETHKITEGRVTDLAFSTEKVADISPVRAFPTLQKLTCAGPTEANSSTPTGERGRLKDLSPLKGSRLSELKCNFNQIADLAPLAGIPLTVLNCEANPEISGLTPLKGMPLSRLILSETRLSDLSPLRGMKLTNLQVSNTKISDLSPLEGMPLNELRCQGTKVRDLAPLRGMQLSKLWIHVTSVSDLSLLKEMPLKALRCDFKPERDAAILRSIKTLKTINEVPAAEFWKKVEAGEVPQAK